MANKHSQEFGKEYLEEIDIRHGEVMFNLNSDIPLHDPLSDVRQEFLSDLSMDSFSAEMHDRNIEDRANYMRWLGDGESLPRPNDRTLGLLSKHLPRFVEVNPEVWGVLSFAPKKRFKIDLAAEDIAAEVADLLPRELHAYSYSNEGANDTIEVPNLGRVEVRMDETRGVFHSIRDIQGENWQIYNCRPSGISYRSWKDISRPNIVRLDATTLRLREDDSGIFVEKDGVEYTNGQGSRAIRNELHANRKRMPSLIPGKNFLRDRNKLSWEQVQNSSIMWLGENVLRPLLEAERPPEQLTEKPEAEPFPDNIDPLFTLISREDAARIALIHGKPERAYPDERHGLGYRKIFAKPRQITALDDLKAIEAIGPVIRRNESAYAMIQPKTAEHIYIADVNTWDIYGDRVRELVKIPILEYRGEFQEGVIIIERDLELDEIQGIYT